MPRRDRGSAGPRLIESTPRATVYDAPSPAHGSRQVATATYAKLLMLIQLAPSERHDIGIARKLVAITRLANFDRLLRCQTQGDEAMRSVIPLGQEFPPATHSATPRAQRMPSPARRRRRREPATIAQAGRFLTRTRQSFDHAIPVARRRRPQSREARDHRRTPRPYVAWLQFECALDIGDEIALMDMLSDRLCPRPVLPALVEARAQGLTTCREPDLEPGTIAAATADGRDEGSRRSDRASASFRRAPSRATRLTDDSNSLRRTRTPRA